MHIGCGWPRPKPLGHRARTLRACARATSLARSPVRNVWSTATAWLTLRAWHDVVGMTLSITPPAPPDTRCWWCVCVATEKWWRADSSTPNDRCVSFPAVL
jgi:hypothetical protein